MNPLLGRQLIALFQRSKFAILPQTFAAMVVAAILVGRLPAIGLAAWLTGIVAIHGLQLIQARVFLSKEKVARPVIWHGAAVLLGVVAGLLWGLLALIPLDTANLVQAGVIVGTAAVAALSLWSMASSAIAFPAYMAGLFVPWAITMSRGPIPPTAVAVAFSGLGVVYLGLFLLIHRQAMELVRMQNHASRVARPVASAPAPEVKFAPVSSIQERAALSTVTLGERSARPYSGVKRRASDYRNEPNPASEPAKASSFGKIKINDIGTSAPHDPASCTILVVEDNLDNQLVALHLLQKRGYRVVIANNGREALSAVERQRFELILMDIQMPEMGGLEATAAIRLKERQGAKRIPIIALTANAASESREICLAAGMDDYLNKPISRTRLFAALDNQLRKRTGPAQ